MTKYSNMRAMQALIKASLQSILKSPSAIIFTIAFPLVFILVFGFLKNRTAMEISLGKVSTCDTNNAIYLALKQNPDIKWINVDSAGMKTGLERGKIAAAINIKVNPQGQKPKYSIEVIESMSDFVAAEQLIKIVTAIAESEDPEIKLRRSQILNLQSHIAEVKEHKRIDFILPGQLGFSLLASGVFGTAFIFFNLRQTLVLKRFFATPVKRQYIVLSEAIARLVFQILGSIIIICIGHFAFDFTLAHGIETVVYMVFCCLLALLVFMGFGFLVSSLAKSESTIPPFSNLVTLPQFLLAGTFFPIENFPKWLQPFCKIMPLSFLNDALRKISFDGANLIDVGSDILWLAVWGIVVYFAASKMFKWE